MSRVVFKLRQDSPNLPRSMNGNRIVNYINYIAGKEETMKNENGLALFGKVEGYAFDGIKKEDVRKYIRQKSKEKTIMHRAIISLKEEDAVNLGFDVRESWTEYLKYKASIITRELNIKDENAEWLASFHNKSGNPHVHIILWDKNQGVKDYFVHENVADGIRVKLIKDMFQDELQELFTEKSEGRKRVKEYVKESLGALAGSFSDMSVKEFKKYKKELQTLGFLAYDGSISKGYFTDKAVAEVAKQLAELEAFIPKKGRLVYGYMPDEAKKKLDEMTLTIGRESKECSAGFHKYINTTEKIASVYSGKEEDLENARQEAFKKLNTLVGNEILKLYKKHVNMERQEKSHDKAKKDLALLLLQTVSRILSCENERQDDFLQKHIEGDLSTVAKKEYMLKMKHKGLDWEY